MLGNPTPTPQSIGAQPANDLLSALVALSGTGLLEKTGAGTAGTAPIGATGRDLIATATQAAARTAIGVESGTWTPAYVLNVSGSVATNIAQGVWWKFGNLVWFTGTLRSASVSSPVGNVYLSLPFAPAVDIGGWSVAFAAPSFWATAMNLTGLINSSLGVTLYKNATNAAPAQLTAADLSTAANGNLLRYSGVYVRE